MKRILTATALIALTSGAAFAQNASEEPTRYQDRATTTAPSTPDAGRAGSIQPADPTEAARKGTISQPSGAGSNAGSAANTTTQPADPEEAARKGGINKPSSTGG